MLTDRECRAAQPAAKAVKQNDQNGLHLLVRPTGFKSWRLKYRFEGKEKQLVLGSYPEVSLREARESMLEARHQLRKGIDPGAKTAPPPRTITFREAAATWLSLQEEGWKPKHARTVRDRIEGDLYPALGSRALQDISPSDLAQLLGEVQARGAIEVAHRLRSYASAIFECAIALEHAEANPAANIARALKPKVQRRYPALLDIKDLRSLMAAHEAEPGQPAVKLASRLLALTAARPGTIRMAERHEFEQLDGKQPIWRIPAAKMKLELAQSEQEAFDFVVPLSRQAVATVQAAITFAGRRKYLFPSTRHSHRPISDNALNVSYRRLPHYSGRHVPHGWRASFSTVMNERAAEQDRPGDRAIIDLMLAHKPSGVEATYNRAAYMGRRREIAQEWADLLMQTARHPEALLHGPRKR